MESREAGAFLSDRIPGGLWSQLPVPSLVDRFACLIVAAVGGAAPLFT